MDGYNISVDNITIEAQAMLAEFAVTLDNEIEVSIDDAPIRVEIGDV